jgi:hypothetical protein
MITKINYVSLDIHKNIPKISVNWKDATLKCILANEQFNFECIKFNPLIIKDSDVSSIYRILTEQLMKKFNYDTSSKNI